MKWEHYLDIQTRGLDAAVLDQVIAAERARSAEGGRFVKTKAGHVPVQVPRPDWIRVEWRPGMLEAMPAAVEVRAPLRLEFDLASATPEQIDEEVLRLIETQDVLAAIALLGVARGMSTGEAQRLVNELTQTLARPPAA